jgi:hypothetical protein
MAILPAQPGLSVQVEVDDQLLLEYDDEDAVQDARSVTKYIEAFAFGPHPNHSYSTANRWQDLRY